MDVTTDASTGNIKVTQETWRGKWLVEWYDDNGYHSTDFEYFADASRYIEGSLLAGELTMMEREKRGE